MSHVIASDRSSASLLVSHASLLLRVTRNDLSARYAGSLLGSTWVMLSPVLILAVYAAVYLFIFRVSVPGLTPVQYVLYIFSGLVPYLATAEALSLGVGSVVANRNVLTSTVFPIDLVPAKAVLTSLMTLGTGLALVLVGAAATRTLRWTCLLLPVLVLLHALAVLGVLWVLAPLNVVFRDLQNVLNLILMLLLVASPIAYTPGMVPKFLRVLILLNPFAHLVMAYQKVLILGEVPGPAHSAVLLVGALGMFAVGSWFFARAKRVVVDYV